MIKTKTPKLKWHIAAGGTCARNDKNSYVAPTEICTYYIDPVSYHLNVNRHLGYQVKVANDKGALGGGLWKWLTKGDLVNLATAKKLCRLHYQENRA